MPQYAVLIYGNDAAPADAMPEEHERYAQEMIGSGVLRAAYALTPREAATSVRGDAITDGPFIEGKEIVAGFYILDVPDLDAALAIARRNPSVAAGGGVEVRPVVDGGLVERP